MNLPSVSFKIDQSAEASYWLSQQFAAKLGPAPKAAKKEKTLVGANH